MQGQVEFLDFISNEKFKFKHKFKSKQRHLELSTPGFPFFFFLGVGDDGLLEQGIIEFKIFKKKTEDFALWHFYNHVLFQSFFLYASQNYNCPGTLLQIYVG